ncbi:family 78 glycoside hydrolase catalytic domain [Terribacillus sp. 179-K 1B1 HS]|uniref:family 78 glycoside hydrolase catalytic domain n=1 Tax=Terribacillus sp. 179-K 1B1 HS TaxID=3142388 RepID=UPI0039A102F5
MRKQATVVGDLRVEYRIRPMGIDAEKPRFSWNMTSAGSGQKQTAYQILVAQSPDRLTPQAADHWDSGKVKSDISVAVHYAGKELLPSSKYYWKVLVWDEEETLIESEESFFETGLFSEHAMENWSKAKWIAMAGKKDKKASAVMFRSEVKLPKKVKEARLYVTALGAYTIFVNGNKMGFLQEDNTVAEELLTPGWTNYDKTIHYFTYDVTKHLAAGENILAAQVGNGWYNGRIGEGSTYYKEDGNDLGLLVKLAVTFEDGSAEIIISDTNGQWKATDQGPIRENDIYDGEVYDATMELDGWLEKGYDDAAWSSVKEHSFPASFPKAKLKAYPAKPALILTELEQQPESITVYHGVLPDYQGENGRGKIKIVREYQPSDLGKGFTLKHGETAIIDLGQNMVGVPSYTVKGEMGTQIQIRFGEITNDDSKGADGPEGSVYFENLRTAKQTSLYTLKGEAAGEIHQDSMTFYGFRFAEIKVLTADASVEILQFTGKVASSSIDDTGKLLTSNDAVNQLYHNVKWGHRGNYFWVPTDCPQRDERLGWTGDTQVFANTALYNAESVLFLESYMDTLVDSQDLYGFDRASFTSVAPGGKWANLNSYARTGKGPKGQAGWAEVGIILPWTIWQMTGDDSSIKKHYPAMVKYMDWLYSLSGDSYRGAAGIGDWLAFQGSGNQFVSDIYYAYAADLMSSMARHIGRDEDAGKYEVLFTNIKAAFIKHYIAEDDQKNPVIKSSLMENPEDIFEEGIDVYKATKEDNSQFALLWVLKLGLYENQEQKANFIELLKENIKNDAAYKAAHPDSTRVKYAENTLSVGFLGVHVIAPVLSDIGSSDLAYSLLLQDQMPSWLYSVKNGATTIWERWNSYSKEDGFGYVGMNSFNHYAYGAIAEWMYKYMAGISNDPDKPGFKHILLQPVVDESKRITVVQGEYDSVYGVIKSGWRINGDSVSYKVTIPANTTATLKLPAGKETREADDASVTFKGIQEGKAVYELDSGSYEFKMKLY